jgi:hypothetical protein
MHLNHGESFNDTAALEGIGTGWAAAQKLATNWQRESEVENANCL